MRTSPEFIDDFKHSLGTYLLCFTILFVTCLTELCQECLPRYHPCHVMRMPNANSGLILRPTSIMSLIISSRSEYLSIPRVWDLTRPISSHPNEHAPYKEPSHAREICELISGEPQREFIVISSDEDEEPIAVIVARREKKKQRASLAMLRRVSRSTRRKQKVKEYIEISSDEEEERPGPSSASTKVTPKGPVVFGPKSKKNTLILSSSDDDSTAVE